MGYRDEREDACRAVVLADHIALDRDALERLGAMPGIEFIDSATVAGRRIAELDPYLDVGVCTSGVISELLDRFLGGLDIVVDQADSLDMATSDRAQLDVERFDLEPPPRIMHGLLGDVDADGPPASVPAMRRELSATVRAPR